jgi:DUF1680 family protein
LGGVSTITGTAMRVTDSNASSDQSVNFTAVPYFAWDNREPGEMIVWLAEDRALARP